MTMLMERMGLYDAVRDALQAGLPALGTCAGMILLADRINDGIDGQQGFGVLDIAVRRNAYGRQLESFEAPLELDGGGEDFPGVFIRAPIVEDAGSTEVIVRHEGRPVGLRKGRTMALAFHPELSEDLRLHREFLRLVRS
jgi:5'-phosphate synthase pdxT subunit